MLRSILSAIGRFFANLLGIHGNATHRAVYATNSFSELVSRVEETLRTTILLHQSFETRARKLHNTWQFCAVRNLSSGFSVGLVAKPSSSTEIMVFVGPWSRLENWVSWLAGLFGFLTLLAVPLAAAVIGLPLPGMLLALISIGMALLVALLVSRLLIPLVTVAGFMGNDRLTDHELDSLAGTVQTSIESTPGVRAVQPLSRS